MPEVSNLTQQDCEDLNHILFLIHSIRQRHSEDPLPRIYFDEDGNPTNEPFGEDGIMRPFKYI